MLPSKNADTTGFDYGLVESGERLQTIAKSIRKSHSKYVVEIGKQLLEAKELLPHGQFLAWVEAEFDFTVRSAGRYMEVVRRWGKLDTVSNLSPGVLYALLPARVPDTAAQALFALADEQGRVTVRDAKRIIDKHVNPKPKPPERKSKPAPPKPVMTVEGKVHPQTSKQSTEAELLSQGLKLLNELSRRSASPEIQCLVNRGVRLGATAEVALASPEWTFEELLQHVANLSRNDQQAVADFLGRQGIFARNSKAVTADEVLQLVTEQSADTQQRISDQLASQGVFPSSPQSIDEVPSVEPVEKGSLLPFDAADLVPPGKLNCPKFVELWVDWCEYNAKYATPLDKVIARAQLNKLKHRTVNAACAAIETAISNREFKIPAARNVKTQFTPPTAEEVLAFMHKKQILGIDPEQFIAYYQTQGWNLSNGQPMQDWRMALQRWAANSKEKKSTSIPTHGELNGSHKVFKFEPGSRPRSTNVDDFYGPGAIAKMQKQENSDSADSILDASDLTI